MKSYNIAVLAGDGIGPEVMQEALKVLHTVEDQVDSVEFKIHELPAGAGEYLRNGVPLPQESFEHAKQCDAILLGAMGLPDVRGPSGTEVAPQLDLREQLDLYCGFRPVRLFHESLTPLKSHRAAEIDLVIVRENTEGLFFWELYTKVAKVSWLKGARRQERWNRSTTISPNFCSVGSKVTMCLSKNP